MSVSAEESAVKVCVRVRPLIEREERATGEDSVPAPLYWKADRKSIHQLDDGVTTKSFSYDRVFSSSETTNHLYQDIAKPLVVSAVEGYNGTIFAYGQTSSGKTFTMMGSKLVPGVIPLSMEEVFQTIQNYPQKEFLLRVSYMEIYNETVTDLLVDNWKRKPLEVREALNKNIYVGDLTEELVTCPAQALSWVFKGEKNRHYGKTKMNERSSRSHTIFRMILESREKSDPASGDNSEGAIIVSHLNLVDLAGSERASQTGAEGTRFKEGCNINRSLFTLAQVIKKLSDESQKGFTNYRDSKLTRILQNSLGGNAKTVIICTITMAALEETLSTLQFASTAKKMKNDPHVTEVSDDGALLKRYRNEIVDLKRRLQEVSSVTHVTATEKESLSQLLQEKDQLQKEQQDRIKNLTKLLVTGSSLMPAKKIPKRRFTWSGKLVRLSGTTERDVGQSDLSFAEHFSRKRKADSSSMELLEEDEECHEEDYSFTTDTGSVRARGDSSDFVSPSGSGQKEADLERRLEEERGEREEAQANVASLEGRLEEERGEREEAQANVASLEGRLEEERGEREEAQANVASLEGRLEEERGEREEAQANVASLEEERGEAQARLSSLQKEWQLHLQVELLAREKREEVERLEQRALELEVQRSAQAQEQQEQVQMLELRLADLQEQSHTEAGPDEQMKKELEESIRVCETLVSEKERVFAERDYLRQEMELLLGQVTSLEKEKGSLAQELRDFKELEEFKALEDDCSDDEKIVLQNEIVSLKSNVESWERKCSDLESQLGSMSGQLGSMSGQLAKKSSWAQELESMQGKDLLQEVSELRRSLDDAEVLGRDTRKEWAVLRSQNLSLKDRDVELSSSHQQMVVEVGGLRSQLEKEKSRFKSMQTDLQKELTMAFKENTKLTALLDGKVPRHLLENVHLEGTIASLKKELVARSEAESALRKELNTAQEAESALREGLNTAQEAESALREGLKTAQEAESALMEGLKTAQEAESALREELKAAQEAESALREELKTAQEAESALREELSCSEQQCSLLEGQLRGLLEEKLALMVEKETLQVENDTLQEEKVALKEEKLALMVEKETLQVENDTLQEEKVALKEEKVALKEEKLALMVEKETLQVEKDTLQEEKDQLQMDLQENVDMMIENQDELRSALGTINKQKEKIRGLVSLPTANQNAPALDSAHMEDLQNQVKALHAELESVRSERDSQSCVGGREEVDRLVSEVSALSQEREQLQALLEALREEKAQLREEMDDKIQMILLQQQPGIGQQPSLSDELGSLDQYRMDDLQGPLESVTEEKDRLEREVQLGMEKVKALHEELESVRSERDSQSSVGGREEVDRLVSEASALSLERAQLQALLEALREEVVQLREKLEDKTRMEVEVVVLRPQEVEETSSQTEVVVLRPQEVEETSSQTEVVLRPQEVEETSSQTEVVVVLRPQEVEETSSQTEVEVVLRPQEVEETSSQTEVVVQDYEAQLQELKQQIQSLSAELQSVRSERDSQSCVGGREEVDRLVSEVSALSLEREQLQALLEALREEKAQDKIHMDQVNLEQRADHQEKEDLLAQQIQQLEKQLTEIRMERSELQEELAHMEEEKTGLQEELAHTEEEKTGLQEALARIEEEKTGLLEALAHMEEEKTGLQEELAHMEEEKTGLQEALAKRVEENRTSKEEGSTITKEKTGLQEELGRSLEENRTFKEEVSTIMKEKTGLQEELGRSLEENRTFKEEVSTITKEKTGLQEELGRSLEENRTFKEEVSTITKEKTGLQEELAHMEEEKTGLQEELARMEQEKTGLQEELARMEEEKTGLQEELARMEEEKTGLQEELARMEEVKTGLQEKLAYVEKEKTGLQEVLDRLEEDKTGRLEMVTRRAEEDTTRRLKESDESFQLFIGRCCTRSVAPLEQTLVDITKVQHLLALPKALVQLYNQILENNRQANQGLRDTMTVLKGHASGFRDDMEELVHGDLEVLEQQRLQDVLLSAPVTPDDDLHAQWERRLPALLDRRERHLQRMSSLLEGLERSLGSVPRSMAAQLGDTGRFLQALRDACSHAPLDLRTVEDLLTAELERSSTAAQLSTNTLQVILETQGRVCQELEALKVETTNVLEEERSKTAALLAVDSAALHPGQLQLLRDNQKLLLQLHRSQEQLTESDESFQLFIGRCCTRSVAPLEQTLVDITKVQHLLALPKALVQLYNQILENNRQANRGLRDTMTVLKGHASGFRDDMEELVHGDLEVLEQQRLQDVLLSAPVTPDDDLHAQWERRLPALLDRRERHLQRMSSLLEGLERSLGSVPRSMAAQLGDTGRFLQALRDACSHAPLDLRTVEDLLTAELERSSTAAQLSTNTLQVILETQGRVCQELEALKVETTNVLEEERSKTAALLAVDSAALHPGQLQLLRDNQKLLLQLHRSQEQLTESDESFQLFIGRCCTRSVAPLEQTLVDITKVQHLLALPKALVQLYNQILENNRQANRGLRDTMTVLKGHASGFRDDMEELVHGDLEVLEQQRLQDVLLSAPVTPDDDLHAQWERRLPALLDRRERHLQRMSSLLEGLERSLGSVPRSMAAQLGDTGRFLQALRDACSHAPLDLRTVEDLLTAELERSSTAAQLSTNTLQVILETQGRVCQELEALKVETTNVLEEERSKTAALLAVDSAALHPGQLQLLRDNQKLLLQLHRSQEQLTALRRELEGLEEAQRRSGERLTINKRTTQLLQTELQDACAKIHDKETAISTLRGKLRLSEEAQAQMQAPPSVLELEELRGKVLKMEVEVTSATTKHQKEVKSLSSLLNIKEESLRKLRETLRKSQKEEQESFLQGEDLYCRLTHPEGSKVQTSGSLERSKLEEEIRLLQLKVAELQSLLSSQKAELSSHQAEISKWRSRALTLKEKTKAPRPHSPAPTTPSKKRLFPDANAAAAATAAASDSARFKQFFDNSTLGINPDISCVELKTDDGSETIEEGSSSAVEQKEEMWPVSPKKEEMCTSQ